MQYGNILGMPAPEDLPQFKPQTIRYYGGKAKLLEFLLDSMMQSGLEKGMKVLDGFTGTSVVAQRLKYEGFSTFANDNLYFAYALADANLAFNEIPTFSNLKLSTDVFTHLNNILGEYGFITRNYSPYGDCKRMYFTTSNASRIDAIRSCIEHWNKKGLLSISEYNYLIACLIYSVNLVSNITGTYGAYLKFWESRATKNIQLLPIVPPKNDFPNFAFNLDVNEAVTKYRYDFIYLDPPYNSRSYFNNYFLLEVIARGWFEDEPVPQGLTGITKNFAVESDFSSKRFVEKSLQKLLEDARGDNIALSYNDEGLLSGDQIMKILQSVGEVRTFTMEHKRYRSINQDGSKKNTKEKLFVVRKK